MNYFAAHSTDIAATDRTICVDGGTYRENVTIDGLRDLTLRGSADRKLSVIDGGVTIANSVGINLYNFAITQALAVLKSQNVTVSNVAASTVMVSGSHNVAVSNAEVKSETRAGPAVHIAASENVRVQNVNLGGFIRVDDSRKVVIENAVDLGEGKNQLTILPSNVTALAVLGSASDDWVSLEGTLDGLTTLDGGAGALYLSGNVDASNKSPGGIGGSVHVLGERVTLGGATIDVSGDAGGGTVLIGGDYRGAGSMPNSARTFVSGDSTINASAITRGNGGKVVVWADEATRFFGTIIARGGEHGGDGGFVEVSGSRLAFDGNVDTGAPKGSPGTLLLDPDIINVGTAATDDAQLDDNQVLTSDGAGNTFEISAGKIVAQLVNSGNVSLAANSTISINSAIDASASPSSMALTLTATNTRLGASITTNGAQTYNGNVRLYADVALNSNGGDITVAGAVNADAASSNRTLTLAAGTANIDLQGNVGATAELRSFTVSSANIARFGGSMNTRSLSAGLTSINVTATSIVLNGDIKTDALVNAGSVYLNGAVTLGADVTIDTDASTSDGNITVTGTINGARTLTTRAGGGSTTLDGDVGTGTSLTSLKISGKSSIGGNLTATSLISVTGSITFTGAAGTRSINAGTGTINLSACGQGGCFVNANNHPLELTADAIDLQFGPNEVTGGSMILLRSSAPGTSIGSGNQATGTLNLSNWDLQALRGFTSVTIGWDNQTGTITIACVPETRTLGGTPYTSCADDPTSGRSVMVSDPVTIRSPGGVIVMNNKLGGTSCQYVQGTCTPNASITLEAPTIYLNADWSPLDQSTQRGTFSLSTPGNPIVINGNAILGDGKTIVMSSSGPPPHTFSSHITINGTLSGTAGGNPETVIFSPGNNGTLTLGDVCGVLSGGNCLADPTGLTIVRLVEVEAASGMNFNGTINIAGGLHQVYPVTGHLRIARQMWVSSATLMAGTFTLDNPLVSSGAIQVTADDIFVNATITSTGGAITLDGDGSTTTLNADIITNGFSITIDDSVILAANVTLSATGGGAAGANITITGAVNADAAANNRTLTLTAGTGNVTLGNPVGAAQSLGATTVTSAITAGLPAISASGNVVVNATTVNLNGAITAGTLSGTASTVNVSSNAARIQNGIDVAAAGATVNVAAGTYAENPNITKTLNVQGANSATTIVNGSVSVNNATNVSLAGLTANSGVTANNASVAFNNVNGSVTGSANSETFTVNGTTASGLTIDGLGGADTYVVNLGSLTGAVTISDTGTTGTDTLTANGTTNAETYTVSATQVVVGTQTVNYTGGIETLNVNSNAGDDVFNVTASATTVINIDGGLPTASDGLTFNGQGLATTWSAGTFTATGKQAVNYTGIEDVTFTNILLTITADDKSKVYGAANPALTATYTGFGGRERKRARHGGDVEHDGKLEQCGGSVSDHGEWRGGCELYAYVCERDVDRHPRAPDDLCRQQIQV